MSPILVRPVREQLEHDRVIRLLQAKYKRKFEVAINPGNEQTAPVAIVTGDYYLDEEQSSEIQALGAELRYKPLWLEELVTLARELLNIPVPDVQD